MTNDKELEDEIPNKFYWNYKYHLDNNKLPDGIMDFDLDVLVKWIQRINPEFVNIGADSNNKKDYVLLEPSKENVLELIKELKKITKVNLKDNFTVLEEKYNGKTNKRR